jgi:hypothetical protein
VKTGISSNGAQKGGSYTGAELLEAVSALFSFTSPIRSLSSQLFLFALLLSK